MRSGHHLFLTEALRETALSRPTQTAFTFLDGAGGATPLNYGDLDRQALAIAAQLQQLGGTGRRALLLYPPGLEFVAAFLGCLYGGVVAVPAYPPTSERSLPRLLAIARDARPALALTSSELLGKLRPLAARLSGFDAITWVATDQISADLAGEWRDPRPGPEALAFLQYTSGSTAAPKGVMVSHGNLQHNEEMIRRAFGQSAESVIVGWLPLYHDMGLIGNVLQPLYLGAQCILMSPTVFLQRPLSWLEAISRYRATTSGAPNFAYGLCVRKIGEEQRAGLDLASWEVAFNGAEPVRPETLERFAQTFAPQGFRRDAFYPCYGLAEATLFVSGGGKGNPPAVAAFDSSALERHEAVPSPADGRSLVGCGRAWMDQRIEIVDPESGRRAGAGQVGEIWISGPSVAQGYWGQREATEHDFHAHLADTGEGPFLRTGDLGFLRGGELFVTGRRKDLLILRGRNLYPQDIERTVEESHPALRRGCGAAFAVEADGEERLVVVQELDPHRRDEAGAALEALRRAVAEEHEAQVHQAVLVRAGTVPKTSSGKIQRHAARAAFLAGTLAVEAAGALPSAVPEAVGGIDREALLGLPEPQREAALRPALRALAARAMRISPAELREDRPLTAFGLDSLAAIEIQYELESALGVVVDLAELLRGITLQQLAARLLAGPADEAAANRRAEMAPVPVAVPADGAPLTHGQEALWFLQRLQPSNAAYNIAAATDVRPALDAGALRRALELLTERHEALRYALAETAAGPVQRVCPGRTLDFRATDATGWSPAQLAARLREIADRPFDLERDPLLRVALFQTSAGGSTLLLVIHHIVADLWSLALLVSELSELYPRLLQGDVEPLPALALRYTDYVAWQERLLAGERGEALWAYWREQLRGELPTLDLPSDRPRPHLQTFNGGERSEWLSRDLLERIRSLGARHDATLYVTLLAAYQALLHRYSGQEEVLVGSPIFGRAAAALADLVGYFVNPVVLRSRLTDRETFVDVLARARETTLGAFEHHDYPFPLLVERLQPERDPSRSPLFQALFVMEHTPLRMGAELAALALGQPGLRVELGGLVLEPRPIGRSTAQLDLELLVAESGRGLGLVLVYNSDLFDAGTVERFLRHLRTLVAAAVDQPERQVAELPLLAANERSQLLVEWNDSGDVPAGERCLHDLVAAQAATTPEAEAVVCDGVRLTYGELERRANRLAAHLRSLAVGPEVVVGILTRRSPEMLVAMLATLKAGGAYLPLDPAYPEERLAFMAEDSRMSVVLTDGAGEGLMPPQVRQVSVTAGLDRSGRDGASPSGVGPGNLAYVIYTSGSTGRPKGVAIEHRNAVAMIRWAHTFFTPQEYAGVLASTSTCFDMSVFEIFATLAAGGKILLAENALALTELAAREEVVLIDTVPSAMAELLRLGRLPSSIRTVNLGGEALKGSLVREIYDQLPGVERVVNLYGPSEDTTFSTWSVVRRGERPLIGRPLTGEAAYVLDSRMQPVPLGVPGALYLGGEGLARGYQHRPDLTAERFVPNPYGPPGSRLYQVGDLVRLLPTGELDYLGRLDHQVKIRGFRIELGEIEAVLGEHAGVREAVVAVAGEPASLVAWIEAVPGQEPTPGELRAFVARKLPASMVPSAFILLAALPRTPNGKVDRRALSRPVATPSAPFVAPATPVEELLAAIWAEVLQVERVGLHDNFFELGGHSLAANRVLSRVCSAFQIKLPLRDLLEVPTVAGLELAIAREMLRQTGAEALHEIGAAEVSPQ